MTKDFEQPDSLDQEVTRTGGESRSGTSRPQPDGDTDASLGDQETGAESCSSLSDLADLGDDEDEPQEIVDLADRYELGEALGRGGMGEVVRALDRRLKRKVAIKRMRAELGASRQAMRRFLTEAVSVAALNHFNVVQIYDYGRTTDGPFLVMELVEGSTLAERLQDGPLPLEDAVEMACQLCNGLQAAHDRGIVHRDIKPANILLTGNGTPKLTDFGLAKEAGDTGHTRAGAVLGTLDYMSPEQKSDSTRADARSDQWSLAATFYQMVTGEVPRVIDTDAIPEVVRDVVRRALKTRPGTRFESVREFSKALQDAVEQSEEPSLHRSSLQEGQCAECGSVNDMARQFCRGCGASLDETCPECGAGEKVWERFCGKCGTDIPAVLEAQIASARELPGEVQSLRSDFRHAEALEKLAPLLALRHPALKEYREWAEQAQSQVSSELSELESQREKLLQAAREQLKMGKFSEAKKYLARIPTPLEDDESRQLDGRLADAVAEVRELSGEIREATRSRNYANLDTQLERYLELKPQDQKAHRLLEKVRQRLHRTPPKLSTGQAEGVAPSFDHIPAIGSGAIVSLGSALPEGNGSWQRKKSGWILQKLMQNPHARKARIALVGMLLLGVAGWVGYSMFAGEETNGGGATVTGTNTTGNEKTGGTPSRGTTSDGTATKGDPKGILIRGRVIKVGSGGDFSKIGDAIQYVKQNWEPSNREDFKEIEVAAGTYPESLRISDADYSWADGARVIVRAKEGTRPILAPSGSDPVLSIDSKKMFEVRGFDINATGKALAVTLTGYISGVQLVDLHIHGFTQAGISAAGAVGFANYENEILIEGCRLQPSAQTAIGLQLKADSSGTDSSRVQITGSQFVGPMSIGVELATTCSYVTILRNVFDQATIGIRLVGSRSWKEVRLNQNTFRAGQQGIVFTEAPRTGSGGATGLSISSNVFDGQSGHEVAILDGYHPNDQTEFDATFATDGMAGNRTSQQAPTGSDLTELNVFQANGTTGQSFRYSSTDSDEAATPPLFDSVTTPRTEVEARAAQQAWATHLGREVVETNSIGMEFRKS